VVSVIHLVQWRKNLTWIINFLDGALKDLKKIDKDMQKTIISYLKNRVALSNNPKDFGKPLGNKKAGLWRYRIDNYRIICKIEEQKCTVLVVKVGKRDNVYD
jgi:mRNA interferase RelE/StbE